MVSIIINTYNRKASLLETIESVLRQSCRDFELIVVDDGSDDGTMLALKRYVNSGQLKYAWQPNSGVTSSRNRGIELSRGDYVSFLDSDILCEKTWLERVMNRFAKDESVGIVGTLPIPGKYLDYKKQLELQLSQRQRTYEDVSAVGGGVATIRRDLFDRIGKLDDIFRFGWEDIEICWRAVLCGYRVVYLYEVLTFHMKDLSKASRLPNSDWEYENMKNKLYLHLKLMDSRSVCRVVLKDLVKSLYRTVSAPGTLIPISKAWLWNLTNLQETLRKRRKLSHLFTKPYRHLQNLVAAEKHFDSINARDYLPLEKGQ